MVWTKIINGLLLELPTENMVGFLSRTPNLDNTTMDKIFGIIKDQGYDPKKFEISKQ